MRLATPSPSPLALLSATAVASGGAALALELVWARQLATAFGASQLAVAATLAGFMLGLGLGSAAGGRAADRSKQPTRLLAALELCLMLLGPTLSLALLRLPALAASLLPAGGDATRPAFWLGRTVLAVVVLLPATTVMGATFPVLIRAAARSAALPFSLSRLYGWNTLGGMAGAVAAGFLLLPSAGIPAVVTAAAAANAVAALCAIAAGRRETSPATPGPGRRGGNRPARRRWPFLAVALASGTLVLGAETLWNRALQVTLANSTTTFTLLLTIFLGGLGAGGLLIRKALSRYHPLAVFAAMESAAAATLVLTALWLPALPQLVRVIRPESGWGRVLAGPLAAGGLLLLPFALAAGAAWPALLAAATPRVEDAGRRVGGMGLANSAGAAVGPLLATWGLLPAVGFGRALLALGAVHAALVAWACKGRGRRLAAAAAAVLLAAGAFAALPRFGRVLLPSLVDGKAQDRVLYYHEGPSAVVTVTADPSGRFRSMFVDNNAAIGTTYDALKITRMLGTLPVLLGREPRNALVIGLGAGVTTATVAGFPQLESIEVAELVPGVAEAAGLFRDLNHAVLRDSRVRLVINDGRNHLLMTHGRYDVITCDPIHPLYGSGPLYSLDFFQLCRRHLAPGGIMCQYLPLHRMPTRELRRLLDTFCRAFPDCRVGFGLGHGVLIGSTEPPLLDWETWRRRLRAHAFRRDLADSALSSPGQIAALLLLGPEACRRLGEPPPSTDLHPYLEFLAPAAFEPGLWGANARLIASAGQPSLEAIRGLPPAARPALERLLAGKRLLLESMLRLEAGDLAGARAALARALQVAPEDPELHRWRLRLQEAERTHGP